MTGILSTVAGFWNPLAWTAVFVAALAIALAIRHFGNRGYKRGTEQAEPFFSGNDVPEGRIRDGNIYWGFLEALGTYYRLLRKFHTGMVNDYVFIYAAIVVLLLAAAALGGMIWA